MPVLTYLEMMMNMKEEKKKEDIEWNQNGQD
jgi:hypothetical protein